MLQRRGSMIKLLLICLVLSGCGGAAANMSTESAPGPNDNTNIGGNQPPAGSSCPGLANLQFMIACPQNIGHPPELLVKNDFGVYLATPNGAGFSFVQKPPGQYITQDGRNCSYTVKNDGSLE